jgi:hypothetical protein
MLMQLHHQSKNKLSDTRMVSRADIKNEIQKRTWITEAKKRYPLPNKFKWLVVLEGSEFFEKALEE